jgi:hypothetical protein
VSSEDDHSDEHRRRRRRRSRREPAEPKRAEISLRSLIIGGGVLVALLVVAAGGWFYYDAFYSPEARALADARSQPLIDMVIADQPDAAGRLRAAVEQDVRNPTQDGLSREAAAIAELRAEFIAPTLRRADDASLIATMAARRDLVEHLNRTNTKVCREFALGGIKEPGKLDEEGQRLYKAVLTAVVAAYRNGRAAKEAPPLLTLQQIVPMLNEAGFTKPDYDKLNSFASLSPDITCLITLKINQVPDNIRLEERGPYARFILGN